MSDFLDLLAELLSLLDTMTKEEMAEAQQLIKSRFVALNQTQEGQCVNCRAPFVIKKFATTHTKKGDEWYREFSRKWKRPASVKWAGTHTTFNGYSWSTVKHYVCSDCAEELAELTDRAQEEASAKDRAARQARYDRDTKILHGEHSATPAKRYWILRERMTPENTEALRAMPYKEFLNTIYWDIVRTYVRYRRGHACELCNSTEHLQVHHRTYEHRGEEYQFLSDLILLCRNCHAKFHDKLGEE